MKVYNDIVKLNINNPSVTIGVFDGLHLGHLKLIENTINEAKNINGYSIIITFYPHPRLIIDNIAHQIKILTTLEEKQILLEKYGVDYLIIIPFTKKFARLSSKKFIKKYLIEKINAHSVIIGYNHHFGKDREGDHNTFLELAEKYKIKVNKIDALTIDGIKISSTIIRKEIIEGNIEKANKYLGYEYFLIGKITYGNKIGSKIGFPTANILYEDNFKLIPKQGVYAVFIIHQQTLYKGMMNIGYRPTFYNNSKNLILEVHIFDFEKDIYNSKIFVIFVARLRDEKKFNSTEELKEQLNSDKIKSLEILNNYKINNKVFL